MFVKGDMSNGQTAFPLAQDAFARPLAVSDGPNLAQALCNFAASIEAMQARNGLTTNGAPVNETVATLTTLLAGADNDLKFTAVGYGTLGNLVTIAYVDPGAVSQSVAVSVSGYAITVSLGTDGGGVITTTGQDIKDEIEAAPAAAALVTVELSPAGDDGSGLVIAMTATALEGGIDASHFGDAQPGCLLQDDDTLELYVNTGTQAEPYWARFGGQRFHKTVTLTSADAATAVEIISNEAVGTGRKVYLQGYLLKVDGATDWGTTATVKIQDKNAVAVDFVTLDASMLDGNEKHGPWSDSATIEDAFAEGTGGTAAKGLQVKGNANGTGSDIKLTVWGVIQ